MEGNKLPERLQRALERWGITESVEEAIKRQGNILAYRLPYGWKELLQRADLTVASRIESDFPLWRSRFSGKRVVLQTGSRWSSMQVNCVHKDEFYEGVLEYQELPSLILEGPHLLGFQNEDEVYPQVRIGPSNQRFIDWTARGNP
ncbi:MAG: hypothetical protein A2940_00740 [Candidatus Wildermuthbacteria bacterium RIFCSPLOWO2_01_FULL_48_29]|uniref:Uncharacterized protein n=2 Tax=Candidatus Wildermuthiibacteriota TaxID=1817923 RepID=A0A1G2RLI6_9BACT|nr:MAG: hypothetical protein A2843_02315 [Candidatus Wildermuthbacteria bacterium RIFCSPHIGHO2_01_FULL_48_27b]OHA73229.1 MAG: hypothetical protein A2940_00740 [Candidatus Wildermuthbacteria bacterium RIFCSPLOWO2_01_FULL_48_29]